MKIVIFGAGSYRVLGIMRSTLAVPGILDGGEINLYDSDTARSEAMGRMLLKTPEVNRAGCRVTRGTSIEEALAGADAVGVIYLPHAAKPGWLGDEASVRHGFITSDNVSPNGSFMGLSIAPTFLELARKMEQHCPNAWLLNFVNPSAVLSAMINNHTKIKALGLCAGVMNHLYDIPRIFGKDEEAQDLQVETAGINHLSFIRKGTYRGKDLFEQLNRHLATDWKMCPLPDQWSENAKRGITNSVTQLVRFYRELGVLIFSTEGDGMDHLKYDEAVASLRQNFNPLTPEEMKSRIQKSHALREQEDASFQEFLTHDLDENFWDTHGNKDGRLKRNDQDVFVRIFGALAGVKETHLALSRPNHGAITGLKDRYAVEATYTLFKNDLKPARPHEVPDIAQGIVAGIASHQTLLGDAVVAQDPRLLADALLAYPMRSYSQQAKALYKELIAIYSEGLSPALRRASDYL